MPRLTISVGLPGSGKTTYLKRYAERTNALYLCADDIREEVYGTATEQKDPAQIWGMLHARARTALGKGQDVVIDGTLVKRADRKALLAQCQSNAGVIMCLYFTTPLELCLRWNLQRDRVVADEVIYKMHEQLQKTPPCLQEGFGVILPVILAPKWKCQSSGEG